MAATTFEFDYKKYLRLISKKRYLFVLVALVIMTVIVGFSYRQTGRYEARCTVFIQKSVISDLVKGIAAAPSFDDKIRVLAYAMRSRSLLLKVINDLGLNVGKTQEQQEMMVRKFQNGTDIQLKDKEGLFIISFSHENAAFARDYVNALVRRYIKENVSNKRQETSDATSFLSGQISTVKDKLDRAEAEISRFRRANGTILAENEATIVREISDAQQKIQEIALKRNQLEAQRNNLHAFRLTALQKRLDELSLVYTDNYPEVMRVKNEIESVRGEMNAGKTGVRQDGGNPEEAERIRMELKTLRESENNLKHFIASRRTAMASIPATRASMEALEQDRANQKNLYEQLMARQGQSEVSKQLEVQDKDTPFRIVDPAILPVKETAPNRAKMILLGIMAGFAGSFGLLLVLDYFDASVRDVNALKSLGVSILAVVPRIEAPAQLELARKRDIRFFICTGVYFSLVLATLSIEYMRTLSINVVNPVQIKESLSQLKNMVMK